MKILIEKKLEEIANCVLAAVSQKPLNLQGSVYSGQFGLLLFLFYYHKYTGNKNVEEVLNQYAARLMSEMEVTLHTFCGGLSGVLYLFIFLRENDFIDIDISDVEEEFEQYLIRKTRVDMDRHYYDFMHGALGTGLYFLKKGTHEEFINEIIDYLYTTSEVDEKSKGLKWTSQINADGIKGTNIALSHGMSSILLFLSRALERGINNEKINVLMEGLVNFLLSQRIDPEIYGSHFPYYSTEVPGVGKSRMAWCYGDLGVGYALWYAGRVLNNSEVEDKGMQVLLHTTGRRSPNEVGEAGICHGCSSMSMFYRRLYLETNNEIFSESAEYWLNLTLDFAKYSDGLAGYKSFIKDWVTDYSLLTGISGIGLVFISYLNGDQQNWDELFLL